MRLHLLSKIVVGTFLVLILGITPVLANQNRGGQTPSQTRTQTRTQTLTQVNLDECPEEKLEIKAMVQAEQNLQLGANGRFARIQAQRFGR